jgi:hypothetical protein
MKKTKLEVDWIAYRKICNRYCHLLNKARTDYYTTLINDNSHDPKKLYRIVNSLCAAPQEDPLPPHNDQINDQIVVEPPLVEYRNPEVKLESFESLSFQDIHDVIMQLSSASCKFHPIPPWLVKLCSL